MFFRGQRSHHANSEDLAGQLPEASGDLDTVFFQQSRADFGVVHALRNFGRVQVPDAGWGTRQVGDAESCNA